MHNTAMRKLEIHFRYTAIDSLLVVSIDDNGIGRLKSFEINKKKNSSHQSFSTRANKTRLDILNSHRVNPISVRIIDKTDEQGKSTGTLVQINIPVK